MARDELLDTEVGGWRILLKVGQGATGSVYEARRGKRRVALKSIRPEVVQPESVERFRREARLLMEIDHPHVVRCFGAGETEDFVYMVLEFCDGGSLDLQIERRKQFPIDESVGTAISILTGLSAIHEKGILHRDVKPGNVLIDSEGKIKLADFNLARGMTVSHDVTTTGTILGTPYYMAPEQVEAKNLGAPLDLYATGAMLYHMISGQPPYQGSSPLQILQKHMNADLPDLCALMPEVPAQIGDAIKALMAKDQAERPQTADEALALFEGLESAPLSVVKARDSERAARPPRGASSSGASTMERGPLPAEAGSGSQNFRLERTHAMDPQQGEAIRRAVSRPSQGQRRPPPDRRQATGPARRPPRQAPSGKGTPRPASARPKGAPPKGRPRQQQRPPPPMARDTGSRPLARDTGSRPLSRDTGSRPARRPADTGSRPARRPADTGSRPARRPADTGSRPVGRPADTGSRPARRPADTGSRPARRSADTGSRPARRPADTGSRPTPRPTGDTPIPAPRPTRPPIPASAPPEVREPLIVSTPPPVKVESLEPGVRQPLPRVRKSKLLDLVVLLLVTVAGLYLYDASQRQRGQDPLVSLGAQLQRAGLTDPEPVLAAARAARSAIDGIPLWAWLPLIGFLLFDRVLARANRVGMLGRLQLRLRANSYLRSGDAEGAAEVYEQLGDRERAARVCLDAGLPERAAHFFNADGNTLQALEVAHPFRALMVQGKQEEAGKLLLDQGKLYPAADVLEGAGNIDRAIEALELGYKTDRIHDYAEHLGNISLDLAKRDLALRIAKLHEGRKDGGEGDKEAGRWAGIYYERAGELERASEQFAEIGDERGRIRCLQGLFPASGKLTLAQRAIAERAAAGFAELKDSQGVELYARLGNFGAAAELCRELADDPQAAQFFARAGRPADGAACAERAGNRQLAAQLYDDDGQHSRAAELYEQLGWFKEAAEAARRSEDPALHAAMLEKLGDLLGAARALRELGENKAALERLTKIEPEHPTWPEGRVLTAEIMHESRKHEEAAAAYGDGLATEVTKLAQVAPTLRYVASLKELDRHAEALKVLERFERNKLAPKDYAKRLKALRKKVGVSISAPARPLPPPGGGRGPRKRPVAEGPAVRTNDPIPAPALRSREPAAAPAMRASDSAAAPAMRGPVRAARDSGFVRGFSDDPGATRAMRRSPPPPEPVPPPPASDAPPVDRIGTSLGPFRLVQFVNAGTFTDVYEAHIEGQLGAEALVKVLKPEYSTPLASGDFVAAGRVLQGVRHDHLLPLLHAGTEGDLSFLAYELTVAPDLEETMASEAVLGVQRAARIGAGILNAITHAHQCDLLHLDLKPSKVFIAPGSLARVHDFGIAQALAADAPHSYVDPRYASPEQARGEIPGRGTDQYTAALLIYKMLTGRLPFSSKTPAGFWGQHADEPPIDVQEYAEVPHGLADALMRALAKDPHQRFPSVADFERVVASFVRGGRESDRHIVDGV